MVRGCAPQQLDGVLDQRIEHGEPVPHARGAAGEVHDEDAPAHARHAARQRRPGEGGQRGGAEAEIVSSANFADSRVLFGSNDESLYCLDAGDGKLIWKAQFSETQKSLSENLFQLGAVAKRGLRWMTAEEMSRAGLTQMLKDFPGPGRLQ